MNEAHTPLEIRAGPLRPWLQTHLGKMGGGWWGGGLSKRDISRRIVHTAVCGHGNRRSVKPHAASLLLLNQPLGDFQLAFPLEHVRRDLFKVPGALQTDLSGYYGESAMILLHHDVILHHSRCVKSQLHKRQRAGWIFQRQKQI